MDLFLDLEIDRFFGPKSIDFGTSKTVPKNGTILGSILGSIFWSDSAHKKSLHCIRVPTGSTLGTPRQKKRVPKNGPKNGLRKDPKIDHFGTHFRGTQMGQFLDLKKGPTQPTQSNYIAYMSPREALLVPPIRK